MRILLEIIATCAEECAIIEQSGGDRIELCAALGVGGLTPSAGLVQAARAATRLPIMMMPVSYTHLDVYKRQVWRRCCGWRSSSLPTARRSWPSSGRAPPPTCSTPTALPLSLIHI